MTVVMRADAGAAYDGTRRGLGDRQSIIGGASDCCTASRTRADLRPDALRWHWRVAAQSEACKSDGERKQAVGNFAKQMTQNMPVFSSLVDRFPFRASDSCRKISQFQSGKVGRGPNHKL